MCTFTELRPWWVLFHLPPSPEQEIWVPAASTTGWQLLPLLHFEQRWTVMSGQAGEAWVTASFFFFSSMYLSNVLLSCWVLGPIKCPSPLLSWQAAQIVEYPILLATCSVSCWLFDLCSTCRVLVYPKVLSWVSWSSLYKLSRGGLVEYLDFIFLTFWTNLKHFKCYKSYKYLESYNRIYLFWPFHINGVIQYMWSFMADFHVACFQVSSTL